MRFINWVVSVNRYDLQDKVVIITGASSGLGEQFVHAFAESGASIAIGSRNLKLLEKVAKNLGNKFDTSILPIETDVLEEDDISHLVQKAVDEFGKLDVMINNVGNYISKPMTEHTISDWHYIIDLNLTSTFIGSREAAKVMIPNKTGCIINMASILSTTFKIRSLSSFFLSRPNGCGIVMKG